MMTEDKRKSKTPRIALWIVGIIIASLGGLLLLYNVSYYSGTEFCPDTFAMRTFSYRKVPITGWVISGIRYNDQENFVGETLIADKWIRTTPEKRWDLVSERASFTRSGTNDDCDARFLTDILARYDYDKVTTSTKSRWLTWSDKHDGCAKVLWPMIAKLARMEMYLAIPDLMEFARYEAVRDDDAKADQEVIQQDIAAFTAELNRRTAEALVRFAKVDQANGNKARALTRFKTAANIDNHPVAIAARDRLESEGITESE